MSKTKSKPKNISKNESLADYSPFDQLDGSHPWMKKVPEGFIGYRTRQLPGGEIVYFNFQLAKEMGLISKDHAPKLNKKLEQKILSSFCLRIINEYDIEKKIKYPSESIKPGMYMATRYLQLQHSNKQGKTSGDGRCIWNGIVKHNGHIWDVSSRGTGVTSLAPGAVEADRNLKSGSTEFGYGCGLAEIDELYGSAIMAEILHHHGFTTERMLAIIDIGDGVGIGVRAAKNLFRPAHLFMYLKQNNWEALERATDFLIDRQYKNKEWGFNSQNEKKYDLLLEEVCESFAQFVSHLDREYVFAWLDWDGDNVLSNAGIIDYGSVRQFGIRHDQYRYDDVERWSTNLNEQVAKAKLMVQVFVQMVDYLKSKDRKPLDSFKKDSVLKKFDKHFEYYLLDHFLYQVGFLRKKREKILKNNIQLVQSLYENFSQLERTKTKSKEQKVADGKNKPAIFNMRILIPHMMDHICEEFDSGSESKLDSKDLFKLILTENATRKDEKMTEATAQKLTKIQQQFRQLIKKNLPEKGPKKNLVRLSERSKAINRDDRVTGNALINIVGEIIKHRKKGMRAVELQAVIDQFIQSHIHKPEFQDLDAFESPKLHKTHRTTQLMESMEEIVEGYKEDI